MLALPLLLVLLLLRSGGSPSVPATADVSGPAVMRKLHASISAGSGQSSAALTRAVPVGSDGITSTETLSTTDTTASESTGVEGEQLSAVTPAFDFLRKRPPAELFQASQLTNVCFDLVDGEIKEVARAHHTLSLGVPGQDEFYNILSGSRACVITGYDGIGGGNRRTGIDWTGGLPDRLKAITDARQWAVIGDSRDGAVIVSQGKDELKSERFCADLTPNRVCLFYDKDILDIIQ